MKVAREQYLVIYEKLIEMLLIVIRNIGDQKKMDDIFKVLNNPNYKPIVPYLVKTAFSNETYIKSKTKRNKTKLRGFGTSRFHGKKY